MPPRAWLIGVALAAASLAGCLGNETQPEPPEAEATTTPIPAGCAERMAVGHGPGGQLRSGEAEGWRPCSARTGLAAFEPTLGVTSEGAVLFAPAQPGNWSSLEPDGIALTSDGGRTWEHVVPSLAGQPTHPISADPFLHHDRETGRTFVDDLATLNCKSLSITDDAGASWNHTVAGCTQTDHQSVFTGPPTTSTTLGYPHVVYRCAANLVGVGPYLGHATTCQRSLDGGLTWMPSGEPAFASDPAREGHGQMPAACGPLPAHGTAGPEGTVYLPRGWCGQPWLAISHDEGLTWERVQVADTGIASWGDLHDHETAIATDREGNLYHLWMTPDRHPHLAVSRDGGRSWTAPVDVAPPDLTQATRPAIAAGAPGDVAIAYVGSQDAPAVDREATDCKPKPVACYVEDAEEPDGYEGATWHAYLATTSQALAEEPPVYTARVNAADEPIAEGYCHPANCSGQARIGHYIDVEIGPEGRPWAAFVDGGERNGTAGQGLLASADPPALPASADG